MQSLFRRLPYFLCYLIAFAFGLKQLREPDIWWQLLSGRWMLENGAITRSDIFSYTMAGTRWINVKWLYEIFIHIIEKGLGPEGVMLLQAVVNIGILWALFHTLKQVTKHLNLRVPDFFTIIAALLFLAVVENRMSGRPEMISHLMTALLITYLWCYPELKWKHFIWPVILQCLWANMHEGYPIGLVILGSYSCGSLIAYLLSKQKTYLTISGRACALFAVAALAVLINPNGIKLWTQPFEIYRQVAANKYTTELFSFTEPEYWTLQAKIHIVLLILVSVFWIIRIVETVRKKNYSLFTPILVSYLLWIALLGYLSLTANRNIVFAQIVLFPAVPVFLSWAVEKLRLHQKKYLQPVSRYALPASIVIAFIFYVAVVNNSFYKATKSENRYGIHISMLHNPIGAVDFIRKHNIKGTCFSDYFVSSYMLWSLYPDYRSFIDLRDLDIFPEKFFNQYFEMQHKPSLFDSLDKKYNFNYAVFSTKQLTSLQQTLYWKDKFNLVYLDPVCAIFLKLNQANKPLNDNWSIHSLFTWPGQPEDPAWADFLTHLLNPEVSYEEEDEINAPIYSASYYSEMKNFPLAIKQLRPAMTSLEENGTAHYVLGSSYLKYVSVIRDSVQRQKKMDSARLYLERAQALDPGIAGVYASLADMSLLYGNHRQAIENMERYIRINDRNDYIFFSLGLTYRTLWQSSRSEDDYARMIKAMKRSVALNTKNGKPHLYLAEGYLTKNETVKARRHFQKAIAAGNPWSKNEEQMIQEIKTKLNIH